MNRAVSTVLDASLAVLLVSAAAVSLATIPGDSRQPPDPDAAARTVLASTATATYQADSGGQRSVSGRVDTLLAHAAVAERDRTNPQFVRAVAAAVEGVLASVDASVAVVAVVDGTRIWVGERPPPGASVAAVTHDVAVDDESATVTVRTWSP